MSVNSSAANSKVSNLDRPWRIEDICAGKVPGKSCVNKFGEAADVDGETDLWVLGSTRTHPSITGDIHFFNSTEANDSENGTGCRTLHIEGVDGSWALASNDITMNGLTAVPSTTAFAGINTAYCTNAGSGGTNEGIINGYVVDTATSVYIKPSQGRTLQTHYYVASGYTLLVKSLFISAVSDTGVQRWGVAEARIVNNANTATPANYVGRVFAFVTRTDGLAEATIPAPFSVPGGSITYLKIRSVSGGNVGVVAGYGATLEQD